MSTKKKPTRAWLTRDVEDSRLAYAIFAGRMMPRKGKDGYWREWGCRLVWWMPFANMHPFFQRKFHLPPGGIMEIAYPVRFGLPEEEGEKKK